MDDILKRVLGGDERAIARTISIVEEETRSAGDVMKRIFPHTGRAFVIGITGPPGVGKSTLVDKITARFRRENKNVGIIAVDPSSIFSGGAILGDRVRMQRHSTDPGVFIRSMATRGHTGGLSRSTGDAVDILDASGKEIIIIETVGVGQDEIEVVQYADTVVVVFVPGLGDDIQAIKAGIIEIADIFAINKADHPGADKVVAEIEYLFTLLSEGSFEKPDVIKTEAVYDRGVDELVEAIEKKRNRMDEQGILKKRRKERCENRLVSILRERLLDEITEKVMRDGRYHGYVDSIYEKKMDPYSAVEEMVREMGFKG